MMRDKSVKKFDMLDDIRYTVGAIRQNGWYCPAPAPVECTQFPALPVGAQAGWYSQANGAFYVVCGGSVYRLSKGASSFAEATDSAAQGVFFADMYISGFSATVIFSGTKRIVYSGYAQEEAQDTRTFSAGTVHCGRFFGIDAADGFKLWWSASHALDWTEGIYGCGYAVLPPSGGKMLALFSCKDRLFAVRERGITVIHAYGDPQNYKIDATAEYACADGIIASTCAMCAGELVFCTPSGIFSFDGSRVRRLYSFGGSPLSSPLSAAACGDVYWLICTHETLGEGELCGFMPEEGCVWAADFKPDFLFAGVDGVYAALGQSVYRLSALHQGGAKLYFGPAGFGGCGHAFLRDVEIDCRGSCELTVISRGAKLTLSGGGPHTVNMGGGRYEFILSFDGSLRSFTVAAEV